MNSWKRKFIIIVFVLSLPVLGFSWGATGHRTIAYIAEGHLTTKAKQKILAILNENGDKDLASVSTWADDIKKNQPEYFDTGFWHFINLPVRKNVNEGYIQWYCRDGNCIVAQLNKEIYELKEKNIDSKTRYEDLKFLIHFIGDLAMPLHCANDNDSGGNKKVVRLYLPSEDSYGNTISLHALWDNLIEYEPVENPKIFAAELEKSIAAKNKDLWANGSIEDWALESYEIAKNDLYREFPHPGPSFYEVRLDKNYYSRMRPIAEEQLKKAGIRLARILNDIFDPK